MREFFKGMSKSGPQDHKTRFSLMLLLIFVFSFPIVMSGSYLILKNNSINNAYNTGRLYLAAVESVRGYVGEELRPVLAGEFPDRFILEGMSRSYVASKVARRVAGELPGFIFKNASLNPRNPDNAADGFEKEIIMGFRNPKGGREWKSLVEMNGSHYYVMAKPGRPVSDDCLRCHGTPEKAPSEVLAKYGRKAGFNMKAGELVDALFIYMPVEAPLAAARTTVAWFMGLYTIFFGLVLALINRRFNWFYEKIDADRKEIEDINAEVLNLNSALDNIVAERTMSEVGLRVADRIRNPATVIGGAAQQLLKGDINDNMREKLNDILSESRKMEQIVTDFDTMVRNKRFLFKREDLNEIAVSSVRLMEKGLQDAGIAYRVELHTTPLRFNANKELMRIAVNHVLHNAMDVTPAGNEVAVITGVKEDNIFLRISDTGNGIPQEELHRIFEPLYSTRGRAGMGLPLVKQIVLEHSGEIVIDSEPDKGTIVEMSFPMRWRERDLETTRPD